MTWEARRRVLHWVALTLLALSACKAKPVAAASGKTLDPPAPSAGAVASIASIASIASAIPASGAEPVKVDFQGAAMGTTVRFVAYTNARAGELAVKSAIESALAEMRRLEALLSEWRDDSEVSRINHGGEWIRVSPETFAVIARGIDAGKASQGTFDITFQALSDIWKFGSAADAVPKVPTRAQVEARRKLVDYRAVELDATQRSVRVPQGRRIGLGGIAKGYIVDRAAAVLRGAQVNDFLVQAGGDLFGAGQKPDGSAWVSGIQDPRAAQGVFFASIELRDHAFSTAGDYARAYVVAGKRYHHIIDPRTGYPATACRSVTAWAEDATTADAIDDAVFILGPTAGLKLVAATPGAGVVIVDKNNKVWLSERLKDQVHVLAQPSDGI